MIVCRLKGGIGNQLFCYAAARRLALYNDAELVLDAVSGFKRDRTYNRNYALDRFSISARLATPAERLEPFERYRRGLAKWRSSCQSYEHRKYLEQDGRDFDSRLMTLKVPSDLYIDGLWQSEKYFKDVEENIRREFTIIPPSDIANSTMAKKIACQGNSVALHVRWFDSPGTCDDKHNICANYYERALQSMKNSLHDPHFFLFSDNPAAAAEKLQLNTGEYTVVDNNNRDEDAYADLWLMSSCKNFIIANSTFSWWGAWLGHGPGKVIIAPKPDTFERNSAWQVDGLIPKEWILV